MSQIENREKEVVHRVLELVDNDAESIYEFIKKRPYSVAKDEHEDYEVKKMLLVALGLAKDNLEYLLKLALDKKLPWYINFGSVDLLAKSKNRAYIQKLLPILEDKSFEGEVRKAVLKALSQNDFVEILPIVQKMDSKLKQLERGWWDIGFELTMARAYLGDKTVLRKLLELLYSERYHERESAEEVFPLYVDKLGGEQEAVLSLVPKHIEGSYEEKLLYLFKSDKQESVRRWVAKVLLAIAPKDICHNLIKNLADNSALVAFDASEQLSESSGSLPFLQEVLKNKNATRTQKLWTVRTLLKMGQSVSSNYLKEIDELFVPWKTKVPSVLREAIVQEYGLYGEKNTDVRYSIEAYLQKDLKEFNVDKAITKLTNRLRKEGTSFKPPVDCGDFHQQGGGTYLVMDVGDEQFYISTLGGFIAIAMNVERTSCSYGYDFKVENLSKEKLKKFNTYKKIAESEGFLVLNKELLDYVVPSLNVYYFGSRKPLSIEKLIFYWQD